MARAALTALGAVGGCAGVSDLTAPTPVLTPVASVEVNPPASTIVEGNRAVLQARVFDDLARPLDNRIVLWSSSDPAVATVSATGEVTAVRAGQARIAASSEGRSATATVTVLRRAVASVQVTPAALSLLVGASQPLQATALDDRGAPLPDRTIVWQTSDALVATVDVNGVVTATGPGVATITASSETRSATLAVTVQPVPTASVRISPATDTVIVGQATPLTAVALDAQGAILGGRVISWSSSDGAVATVSSAGLVLGVTAGTATITASNGGRDGTAVIVVRPRPVGAVIVSPAQANLSVGQTVRLTVQVTDASGTLLTGRPTSFTSADVAVARVAADGTVTGVGVGTTTITVTSEGRTGTATISVSPSPVAGVRVTPGTARLAPGERLRFTAEALDVSGAVLAGRAVTWLSGAQSVFSVASDGTVNALTPGRAVLFAQVEGRSGTASIEVRAPVVNTVSLAPATVSVQVGQSAPLTVTARDSSGSALVGQPVTWRSSDVTVAVVSSDGRVRGVSPGTATVTATVGGVSASVAVTVRAIPVAAVEVTLTATNIVPTQTTQATAALFGAERDVLTGRSITWTSSNPTVATVSPSGLVVGVSVGSAVIRATAEGITGSSVITVGPPPVASVTFTLAATSVFVTQTVASTVVLRDAQTNVLSGRSVTYASSNTAVATVSSSGVVTGVAPGTATITATSEGISASASITVQLAPVASVTATLAQGSIAVGSTTSATAVLRDAFGNVLTGRALTWSSSTPTVATVSSAGVVTALAVGTTTITATSEGQTGSVTLTVIPVPVASVTITLGSSSVEVGAGTTSTVVVRDASGNVLTGRPVTFASSNAAVATVNGSGDVTTLSPGTTTISATSEGITGTALLTVTPQPVATVTVTLDSTTMSVGSTAQATAVTRSATGTVLTGRPIAYTSSDPAVATVSASGAITAVGVGSVTITATSEGQSGTASLTVTLPPVATVTVSATSPLTIGQTTTASAELRDAKGNVLTGRAITWSTSDAAVATVDPATGVITAVAAGSATITATSEGQTGTITVVVNP